MVVEGGRERLKRHHTFDPDRELEPRPDAEYAEEFRALLTEAVRCPLPDGKPAGALLSGGLDTSSILCLAGGLPGRPVQHAFSAVFDEMPECDERGFMAPMVEAAVVGHHLFHADEHSPLADWAGTGPLSGTSGSWPCYLSEVRLSHDSTRQRSWADACL